MRQNSINWHAWRLQGIGGSDAPIIMEAVPWSTPLKLWEIKTERTLPDPPNFPMKRGLKMEPVARKKYEQMTGLVMPATPVIHTKMDFIRASLDGLNLTSGKGLEIKCPGREDHAIALEGKIPDKYIWQCVHNCLAGGLDTLDYFSFDGEDGVIVPFERDLKLEKQLLDKELPFWECVQNDIRPEKEMKPAGVRIDPFRIRSRSGKSRCTIYVPKSLPPAQEELPMNNQKTNSKSPFTAREVVEILERARELGVIEMRLEGFEASFKPQVEPMHDERESINCERCGTEKTEGKSGGLYCYPCWRERKESSERKPRTRRRSYG